MLVHLISVNVSKCYRNTSYQIYNKITGITTYFADYHFHRNAGKPLIISQNGASGDYPGCSDIAYDKAVSDGADVIECPIQLTKDGIPLCMSSYDILYGTAIRGSMNYQTPAVNKVVRTNVPGLYTFNFTWDEIISNFKRKYLYLFFYY